MRVIAGKARRLNLKTTPGLDTRPTADKVKETLFNILSPYVPGCRFLDLFAGSGAIGIEALSREASFCVFVDKDPRAVRCIKENLEFTHLAEDSLVIQKNVLAAVAQLSMLKEPFDVVYLDPPYEGGLEAETLRALSRSGVINEDTMIILEAAKRTGTDFLEGLPYDVTRIKDYKNNRHIFMKLTPGGQEQHD